MSQELKQAIEQLTALWQGYMPDGYAAFLTAFKAKWQDFAAKRKADPARYALAPFKLGAEGIAREPEDPRWLGFCGEDLAAIDDYFGTQKANKLKTPKDVAELLKWINFVRQVNGIAAPVDADTAAVTTEAALRACNAADSAEPEPTVPQHFQGNLFSAPVITVNINPGLDRQLAAYPEALRAGARATREGVLAGLRTASGPFASIVEEKKLTGPLATAKNRDYLSNAKQAQGLLGRTDTPVEDLVADCELVAYQTKKAGALPRGIEDWPSSRAGLAVIAALIKEGDRLLVLRQYEPVVAKLGLAADETFLRRSFEGINGGRSLSAENLVSGREKREINALRRTGDKATIASNRAEQTALKGDLGAALDSLNQNRGR
ncbi:hypothetical protein [Lacticaseibacillus kribbianus]|uniref:hypothetical protein n=1 Tax=Lacticaseibacillus kribbianus TaxID=2926292 RepID=UPI001CD3F6D3|nr:hypothetical protein [Lacticaseibacillus kribbianus]